MKKLKELFFTKKNWIQRSSAINKHGQEVDIDDPCAVKFCLMGGLIKTYRNKKTKRSVMKKINKYLMTKNTNRFSYQKLSDDPYNFVDMEDNIVNFNDNCDFRAVKNLVNKLDI